jgi:hypothetical protein
MNAVWVKSSRSFSNGNCVEVAELPGGSVGVRHSKDPAGPVLQFTRGAWNAFLGATRRRTSRGPAARPGAEPRGSALGSGDARHP